MPFIVREYFETLNADFRGNPLVTAFPPIDHDTVADLMQNVVHFDAQERTHSGELRIQYVMRLLNFFLPLNHQSDFCLRLWSLICYGYKLRNPLKRASRNAFAELMQQIRTKGVRACKDGTAFDAMLCALLIGTPGTGKTTSIKSFLARLGPGLLHHTAHGEMYQLLYITVQAPKSGSAKALAQEIFNVLRSRAIEAGLPMPYTQGKPKTEAELAQAITVLAQKLHLGVLVLDELQHLYRGNEGSDNDAMKFLMGVINRLGIPVLLVGTWECAGLLGLETRIARRATGPADAQFRRMQNDEEWKVFMSALFSHQFTRSVVELSDDLCDTFYFHTQGIQDLAVKLMMVSQIDVIVDESERLTRASVDATAKRHFPLIAPIVRMLRDGRRETDPTLWDMEPSDLDAYMQAFAASARVTIRRGNDRRAMTIAQRAGVAEAVAASLEATQNVGSEDASALADAAVTAAPHLPAADHVAKILTDITGKAPRPTKSRSSARQKDVSDAILAFDDSDLRKILFRVTRESDQPVEIENAIRKAGHLSALTEEFA